MKLRVLSLISLFILTTAAFANEVPKDSAPIIISTGKLYVGFFGGGGSSNSYNASQLGTAFFIEADGGPLAVNAFGQLKRKSTTYLGAQLGYQWQDIVLNSSPWTLAPAAELETFVTSNNTFKGTFNNNTDRAPEHTFVNSYPMSRSIFLVNGIMNFNNPRWIVRPYLGFGIGTALVRISGADSTQVNPAETLNHYNTNPSDTNTVFAGQIKLGLSYDINQTVSLFADYRWLYIASTHFVFGSTVAPTHVPTTNWQVKLDPQRYNLFDVGIKFNLV